MTAQETKKTEISIFSENDKAISEIMATSKTLVITDLEDKEQYDKVHNQRMALVKMRTQGIDPKEEELTNPLKGKLKEIKDEASRLRTIIKDEEVRLEAEEKKVDEHKETIRKEKEKKAQEKLQNRLDRLKEVEGTIDLAILQRLTDGEFEEDLAKFKKSFDEKIALELEEKSRPEREKLLRYVDAIASIPVPEVTVPDNVRMLSNIQNTIEQMKKLVKMLAVDLKDDEIDAKELKDEEMRAEAQADGEQYDRELEESNNQI